MWVKNPSREQGLSQAILFSPYLPLLFLGDCMWYDVDKTLSHNCLLNFVVGPRGVGKTYSAKNRVIKNYLKKGEQFVYLRRYDTEIKASNMENFFEDIAPAYPDHDFLVKHNKFYIDQRVCGFYVCLSKAAQLKSIPFPNVSMIIFDEFIIDTGLIRYLPNEIVSFNELYSTVSRLRDVIVLFLSNAITFTNPYFLFFDLRLQQGQKIAKKGDILLEMVDSPVYMDASANTRFGKIISGTSYGDYAIKNKFLRDNESFIERLKEPGVYLMTLRIDEHSFGVYLAPSTSLWYISEKVDKSATRIISVDMESHDIDSSMSKELNASIWYHELQQKYYRAEVRFCTMKAKNVISQVLKP